jgi:outer membrane protein OmpA-like peptidoglycan-associated protein
MAKCRPSKWVPWAFLGAGLPLLAAYVTTTGGLTDDIKNRASQVLSGDEQTAWAKIDSNGRDFMLQGTAPSQEAVDKAVMAVAGTYGVRTLTQTAQIVAPVVEAPKVEEPPKVAEAPKVEEPPQVVEAVKLAVPTVLGYVGNATTPTLTGTWPEVDAKAAEQNLEVKLGDSAYILGKNPELTSDGAGNWSLKPSAALPEGELSVMPSLIDKAGVAIVSAVAAKAVIDITPPAMPTLTAPAAGAVWPYAITGTWPEQPGNSLSASVGGRNYTVNRGAALTSDGKGNFSFAPSAKLAPGSYDIDFTVNDAVGNKVVQTMKAAIVIPEPVTPPPPPVPAKAAVVEAVPAGAVWPYAITGTWDERPGNTLTATVAGRTYVLGRGAALTSDGAGKFTFAPSAKFAPGSYDVDFTTNDLTSEPKVTKLAAGIVVPEPVAAPVVTPAPIPATAAVVDAIAADAKWPYAITGTWDERPGNTLTASVAGRNYVLGRGAALTSDGAGKFIFAPSAKFAPGSYPVVFTTNDFTSESKITTALAAIVVPEPPAPPPPPKVEIPAPTVVSQLDLTGAPLIKGTWPSAVASALNITLNGRTYVLGTDANLGVKGDNWTLFPGSAIKDGVYDVAAVAADTSGNSGADTTNNELEVDVEQPATPTVMTMTGDKSPDHLSGSWDEAGAKGLKVTVPQANITAELGAAGSPLTTDGAGKWRLNLAAPLPPGTYNVVAESIDNRGRIQADASEGEVVVVAAGATPPPKAAAFDCVAAVNRIGSVFPIRFEYDLTNVVKPYDLSVAQYAALLKDPRCLTLSVEIDGHADFRGPDEYNVGLSDRRAILILNELKDAGVDASRMSVKALGESQPLDPALTDEARMKNRRVEITPKP